MGRASARRTAAVRMRLQAITFQLTMVHMSRLGAGQGMRVREGVRKWDGARETGSSSSSSAPRPRRRRFDSRMDLAGSASLLKTVLDRVCTEEMQVATYTRLLYVAEAAAPAATLHAFFNAFVAEERARDSTITGLLVLQDRTCLHLVESQPETVVSLMRALAESARSAEPLLRNVRVVAATEDCPAPLFGQLLFVQHSFPASFSVDMDGEDAAVPCFQVYSRLLDLATFMPAVSAPKVSSLARPNAAWAAKEAKVRVSGVEFSLLCPFGLRVCMQEEFEAARSTIATTHASLVPSDDVVRAISQSDKVSRRTGERLMACN